MTVTVLLFVLLVFAVVAGMIEARVHDICAFQ
jgi:hypothetical protein